MTNEISDSDLARMRDPIARLIWEKWIREGTATRSPPQPASGG